MTPSAEFARLEKLIPPEKLAAFLGVVVRLPPDLWDRLRRKLEQAADDPKADGRKIVIELGLDRAGNPSWRGTRVLGAWEHIASREKVS